LHKKVEQLPDKERRDFIDKLNQQQPKSEKK
jgi:hypothetical protein